MAGDSTEKDELQPDVVEKEAEVAAEAGGDLVLASDKEPEAPKASVTESDTAPAEEEAAPVQEKGATKDPVEPAKATVAAKDPVEPAKAPERVMNVDPLEISSRAASENQKYLLSVAAMGNRRMIDILAQRARKSGGKDQSFQTVSMALSIISSHYADEISKDNFASQYGTMLNCYANLYRACDMYLQGGSQSSSRLRGRGAADMQNTKYAMQAMEVARQDVTTIRNQGPRLAQRAEPISWGRFFGEAAVGALQMDRYARAQMGQRKAQGQQMQSAAVPQNQGAAQGADAVAQAKALPEGMQFLSGNGSGNSLQLHENSLRSSLEYMGESKIVPKIVVENILGLYASYCVSKKDGDHVGMRLSERLIMVQCTRAPKSAVLAQLSRDCGMAMERRLEEQDEQFASNEKLSKGMDKVTGVTPEQVKKMCDTVRALERGRKEGISNEEQMKLLEYIVNDVGASPMRAAGKHVGLLVKQCQRMLYRMKNPKAPPPSKSSVPSKEAASTSSSDSTKSESSAKDVSKEIAKVASDDTAKDASEEVAKVASDDSAKVASEEVAKVASDTAAKDAGEEVAKDASDTAAKDASEGAGEQKKEPEKAAEATTKLKALPEGMQFLSKNGSGNTIKFNGGMLYACLGHMGETKIVPRVVIENILEMYARYCVYRAEGDQMGMRHAAKLISIQCSRVSKKSAVLAQLAKDCDTAIERRSEGQNEKSVSKEKLAKAMDTGNDTAKDASADTAKSVSEGTAKDAGKDAGKDTGKDTGKDAGKDAGAQKKEPEKAAEVATKPKKLPEGIQFLSGKGSGNTIQFNETGLRYCLKYMGESKMVSAPVMENILGLLARYYLHKMDGDRTGMRVTERLISIQCSRVPKSTVLTQLAKDCETATERRREEEDEQFASDEKLSKGMDTAAGVTPEQVKEMCDAVRALERGRKENMSSEEQIKLLEYIVNDVGASPMRTMKHVGPLVKQCQRILQRMKNSKAPPPSTSSAPS